MKALFALFLFTATVFAQFNTTSPNVAQAIEFGHRVNPSLPNFPVHTNPEAAVTRTHKAAFNLAARDTQLEADVASRLAPTLSPLRLTRRIALLVITEERIPYARITNDGVFVMTSLVARKEFGTGRDFTSGLLLRELARFTLVADFGQAVSRGDAGQLQLVDLKITALAVRFAHSAGLPTTTIQHAITFINVKAPGTPSTYPTDRILFAGHFVANNPVSLPATIPNAPRSVNRFLSVLSQTSQAINPASRPVIANNRTAEELHLRSLDRAPSSDHAAVIAAV